MAWSRWASACARLAAALLRCAFSASSCRCASSMSPARFGGQPAAGAVARCTARSSAPCHSRFAPGAGSAPPAAREHQRRLRLSTCAWLALICAFCTSSLGIDILDAGLRGRNLRLRLLERDAIIAVIDTGNHFARSDMLVVGDGNGGDVTGNLWRERRLPRGDEGIVGRLIVPRLIHIDVAATQHGDQQERADCRDTGRRRRKPFSAGLAIEGALSLRG